MKMTRLPLSLFLLAVPVLAAPPLTVLPGRVELRGPEARHQLLAEATTGEYHEDQTRTATWTSANPQVVAVDAAGVLTPVGDGEATVTVKNAAGQTATAAVKVTGAKAPFAWNFRNHVIPAMTKAGCNQGACHGALAGKGGFRLTLRGYDPEVDYDTLTRQAVGRRVSMAEPASSLLLQKAVFGIPHGGGQRFKKASLEYRVVHDWITAGAPAPTDKDPEVTGLEVYPAKAILKPGMEQQLVVRAKYSDGRVDDVTRWVKFTSANEGVALVDDNGRVKTTGHGEAPVTLWYNSKVLYARITVPYENPVDPAIYTQFPRRNFVDDHVLAKLKSLRLAPSKVANDSAFLRRAYLDATGTLPTAEDVEQFLADQSPDKRDKLVDALLARDEFADYWAYKWSDLLLISSRKLRPNAMWAFYDWVRDSVKTNKPWDRFAREIFTATGSSRRNGALNYFVMHQDTVELAENVTQAFLGQRLTCARCHNHPMEKWTQKQYYQFANLFSRVGIKNGTEPGENVVFVKTAGEINHPRLLRPLAPTPLDGTAMDLATANDRRAHFAQWLTDPQNSMFSRNLINRVWANFLGRGLADPVDDLRATNPASNEELFTALEQDFVKNGYDVKRLIRTIMMSGTYQLSAESNATNQNDSMFYSRYAVRRLPGEVLLDAMSQVNGVPTMFPGYARGTRAMQLPDVRVQSQFLNAFGRPARVICDASERSSDPSIAQALHVINGDTLNQKLASPDGYVALAIKLGLSDRRILEHAYLSAYSRYPTDDERDRLTAELAKHRNSAEARKQALEDMLWAVLTSKEFLFTH